MLLLRLGKAPPNWIVPLAWMVIVSSPGVTLASRIACRSDPRPPSTSVVTGKTVGTARPSSASSRGRNGSRCREDSRAARRNDREYDFVRRDIDELRMRHLGVRADHRKGPKGDRRG